VKYIHTCGMVFGVIFHSTDGSCTTFLSCFYGSESNDNKKVKRREIIVQTVEVDIQSRRDRRLTERPGRVKSATDEEGVFWVPRGELFSSPKVVLWRKTKNVAYTLICEEDENPALGSYFLESFPNVLSEYYKKTTPSSTLGMEFFLRPEEVLVLLQSFLPNGQLLFISPNLSKHLKKEAENTLSKS